MKTLKEVNLNNDNIAFAYETNNEKYQVVIYFEDKDGMTKVEYYEDDILYDTMTTFVHTENYVLEELTDNRNLNFLNNYNIIHCDYKLARDLEEAVDDLWFDIVEHTLPSMVIDLLSIIKMYK